MRTVHRDMSLNQDAGAVDHPATSPSPDHRAAAKSPHARAITQ